jgi:hypothetical protein
MISELAFDRIHTEPTRVSRDQEIWLLKTPPISMAL